MTMQIKKKSRRERVIGKTESYRWIKDLFWKQKLEMDWSSYFVLWFVEDHFDVIYHIQGFDDHVRKGLDATIAKL